MSEHEVSGDPRGEGEKTSEKAVEEPLRDTEAATPADRKTRNHREGVSGNPSVSSRPSAHVPVAPVSYSRVLRVLYVLQKQVLCRVCGSQGFLLVCSLSFQPLYGVFHRTNAGDAGVPPFP